MKLIDIKLHHFLFFCAIFFIVLGFFQPTVVEYLYLKKIDIHISKGIATALFFTVFVIILFCISFVIKLFFEKTHGPNTIRDWYRSLYHWQTPVLTSVARIGLSISLATICFKYIHLIYADGFLFQTDLPVDLTSFPKIIDQFIPFFNVGPIYYQGLVLVLCGLVVAGLFTRITFPILWILTWYLVSHYEATNNYWSHGASPVLMTAFPLMFHDLRGRYYLKMGVNTSIPSSPFLPIFFAQVFAALFFFGAFFSKMMLGGLAWMTSDHIRNSFHIAWSFSMKADVELPIWMDYLLSSNILLLGSAFTHLLLQALPILAIIYPFSKFHRNFEGTAYAISCVFLWAFMGYIWPWYWWLPMAAIFFAYDKRDVVLSVKEAPAFSIESWYGIKYAFVTLFIFGFITQIPAIRLNAFPFIDALSFYAVPYDTYPFESKVARIIPTPGLTMDSQECIGKQSCLYKKRHLPNDKNSPVYFAVSNLSGEEQLEILDWCSKKSNTFCSSNSASDRALWTGFYNADTQDFELVYAGVTALHTTSGGRLTTKYLPNNHRVEFSGNLIEQIDRVQVVELSPDRTHMNDVGGDISLDGSGLNLPKTSSCLIGLEVLMKDGRKIPFLGTTLCLWRKA